MNPLLLLLSLSIIPFILAASSPSPVLDINGDKVQAGPNYFILPVIRGRGGGLTPFNVKQNNTCPRDIMQWNVDDPGLPVVFTRLDAKKGVVRLSTDLNVRFYTPTICARETIWKVGPYDDKVQAGPNYFILPVIRGRGGGLAPTNVKQNNICPRDIIMQWNYNDPGLPVVFTRLDAKKGVVRLSTDLNVRFYTPTSCNRETIWKVGPYDDKLKQYFVVTGGVEGNPGKQTLSSWFKIEKLEKHYKFVFCPSVCKICKVICKDVGIFRTKDGVRFLALSDTPHRVMFKKTF